MARNSPSDRLDPIQETRMATRVMRVCAVLALAAAPLAAQQDDPVIDAGASPHSIRQWIAVGESEAGWPTAGR
jgi:hypothetical protein